MDYRAELYLAFVIQNGSDRPVLVSRGGGDGQGTQSMALSDYGRKRVLASSKRRTRNDPVSNVVGLLPIECRRRSLIDVFRDHGAGFKRAGSLVPDDRHVSVGLAHALS